MTRSLAALLLFLIELPSFANATTSGYWVSTNPMNSVRSDHTATLLLDGTVLVTGGGTGERLGTAELYDPASGTWGFTRSLNEARSGHTATLLPSGKVLVVGGQHRGTDFATAELYDPASGTWHLTGTLNEARSRHTATLLSSGKVLVIGGSNNDAALSSAELYDPVSRSWELTAPLANARYQHTATLLSSGKVLVVGGAIGGSSDRRSLSSTELYDPASGTWASFPSLMTERFDHTATLLPSGKVLVVGGCGSECAADPSWAYSLSTAEFYDTVSGTWQSATSSTDLRAGHTATLLSSGHLLFTGGWARSDSLHGDSPSIEEIYNPEEDIWVSTEALGVSRVGHTATLLPGGDVLVVGGAHQTSTISRYESSAELYSSSISAYGVTGSPTVDRRSGYTTTLLPNGKLLVLGGSDYEPSGELRAESTAELYEPDSNTWELTGFPKRERNSHTATLLVSGRVLAVGGKESSATAETYDPDTGIWSLVGSLKVNRSRGHVATLLPSGKVLVSGGKSDDGDPLSSAELYDPNSRRWELTGPLTEPRSGHTATLLLSGKVLVVEGGTAELYDPETGTWKTTGLPKIVRSGHTATLLPSGDVLVVGDTMFDFTGTTELYDPKTGTWEFTGSLITARDGHTATLLPSGKILVVGGWTQNGDAVYCVNAAELYNPASGMWESAPWPDSGAIKGCQTATLLPSGQVLFIDCGYCYSTIPQLYMPDSDPEERRPVIETVSPSIAHGRSTIIAGAKFVGDSEANGGTTNGSAVNFPLIQLSPLNGGYQIRLIPDSVPGFGEYESTVRVSNFPPTMNPGPHFITIHTSGLRSRSKIVQVACGLVITEQPADVSAEIGSTVTFAVETQGGRKFQWQKDGSDIPGAVGATYTTPPINPFDSGSTYRVRIDSGCKEAISRAATLTVHDDQPPAVEVLYPTGGEYWLLSDPDKAPNVQVVTWSMSDNVRICRIHASLLYSNDGGLSYAPAVSGTFGREGTCAHPGVGISHVNYPVPTSPPSGTTGSLYKVRIEVTDHAGLTTAAESERPFFIVQPSTDSVKTLILLHGDRMRSRKNITEVQSQRLTSELENLANHPSVQGRVVDLKEVTSLSQLYAEWDEDPADFQKANDVLFAEGGVHDYLQDLLQVFTGVKFLILVGDDPIIPMARLEDRAVLRLESNYASDDPANLSAGLTATGTTVGRALAADRYLSDDPLAVLGRLRPSDLQERGVVFIPDLPIGRLVETPEEIIKSIATYISQNGVLDLSRLDPQSGNKVMVSGYDFLIDVGRSIRRRWKSAFRLPLPHDDASWTPVDGQLLSTDWGEPSVEARLARFYDHLSGHGSGPYALVFLLEHAGHYGFGIPGNDPFNIQGLNSADIYGIDDCHSGISRYEPLDLAGRVVVAVGCHAGLSVPGSCAIDPERSLDLPQTMLARGVAAYIANSGYGWGLMHGIGLSERIVEILTEELTRGGTLILGDAVRRVKLRYFMESARFDAYDEKTSMQWTFYGFPMYAIKTGIAMDESSFRTSGFHGIPPKAGELAEVEEIEGVEIRRRLTAGPKAVGPLAPSLPPCLTRVEESFDFTAAGVHRKHRASGEELPDGQSGCPDSQGCYYTLHGLASGDADLPIQPLAVFDSRLSGTSQHGILWKGGSYLEEHPWTPVFAELTSNGADGSAHESTPRQIYRKPVGPGRRILGAEEHCRPTDLDLSSTVITTAELVKRDDQAPVYSVLRLHRKVDLEVFYFNNTFDGEGNCDRMGPVLGDGPHHEVRGTTIHWAVPANDEAGVWRVVVVYADQMPDEHGNGRWIPLELEADDTGIWRGSLWVPGPSQITYYLQAVDRRGNVSWLDYEAADEPASGVELGIPLPVDVAVVPGSADLAVRLLDAPDPVATGEPLIYTIAVHNLGPDPASAVEVTCTLPDEVAYVFAGGEGWSCGKSEEQVTCTRDVLAVGGAPDISILATAPPRNSTLITRTWVRAVESDPVGSNNFASERTEVKR